MASKTVKNEESSLDEPVPTVGTGIMMPRFNGHGPLRRFLDDFERYGKLKEWTGEQMCNVLPLSLTGIARDAFDSLSADQTSTFQKAVAGLKAAFVTKTVTEQHLTLRELKFSPESDTRI